MSGTGFVARTAANTYAQRTLQVTASSGITLTNADGVSGNPTINVASTSNNASNNLVLRDASGDFAANVITADLTGDVTGQVSSIANHDTDALTEGVTNLYFTDERVDDRVAALVVGGTGVSSTYDDVANSLTLAVDFTEFSTTDITEGTNLYYTTARANADFDTKLAAATTTDLTEGTNLYFTNARADARADARIAAATTDDLTEGVSNLYYTDARADARVAAATGANLDLTNQTTTDLTEGTNLYYTCLLYTSPSPRDQRGSRMPSSA